MRPGFRVTLGAALATATLLLPAGVATATTRTPHLIGCNESSQVRPRRFNPICNDGNGTVIRLRWSRWSGTASGSGKYYTSVRLYDVRVSAWRVRRHHYTRFHYDFPRRVPHGLPRSWTIKYYAGMWHGRVV